MLHAAGLTPAEYAVLWHVHDTLVAPREVLAAWVAEHLPRDVPSELTVDQCRLAIEALINAGALVELTAADLEHDRARWRAEPLPVSGGVDRGRAVGEVDLTAAGFQRITGVIHHLGPGARAPRVGYDDRVPGVIRVFGETADRCHAAAARVIARIAQPPWSWPRETAQRGPLRSLGPWWYGRYERVPTGFEIVVRRADSLLSGPRTGRT